MITNTQKRAYSLTEAQKEIVRGNPDTLDSIISRLPGMEGTSVRQISDYRKRISRQSESDHRKLADHLTQYIAGHGLPSRFGDVMDYILYLREQG